MRGGGLKTENTTQLLIWRLRRNQPRNMLGAKLIVLVVVVVLDCHFQQSNTNKDQVGGV